MSPSYGLHYSLKSSQPSESLPPTFTVYTTANDTTAIHIPTLPYQSPHHPPSLSAVSIPSTLKSTLLSLSRITSLHVTLSPMAITLTLITALPPRATCLHCLLCLCHLPSSHTTHNVYTAYLRVYTTASVPTPTHMAPWTLGSSPLTLMSTLVHLTHSHI